MTDPITPPPAGGDEGVGFAAGVAAATAAQATEIATEAEAIAGAAVERATDAEATAWDARSAVDELRGEMLTRLDEIAASLQKPVEPAAAAGGPPEGAVAAPAPEQKAPAAPQAAGEGKKKRAGYGAKGWFGPDKD